MSEVMASTLYSFLEICKMEDSIVFTNPSMKGNVHAIVGSNVLILKPKGWEIHVNPLAQVSMKRFVLVRKTTWNSELMAFTDSLK